MEVQLFIFLSMACLIASGKIVSEKPAPVDKAICVMVNSFNNIHGVVSFEKVKAGVLISGKITGLPPGPHGFHVHEKGDIRDPHCITVGKHFNPYDKHHGGGDEDDRHVGDLGNINADHNGRALFSFIDKKVGFEGPSSVIGRALVVCEGIDDLGKGYTLDSKTTGNEGQRLACGVIGYG